MAEADSGTPPTSGSALTNWRLKSIEEKLDNLSGNYVPLGIYNINQENIGKELAALHVADTVEKAERQKFESRLMDAEANADKYRKQVRLAIVSAVVVFVLELFVTPISRSLGWTT